MGDGTFQAGVDYATNGAVNSLAAGDFNHDGKLDLAIGIAPVGTSAGISFMRGNGDGSFQAPVQSPTSATGSVVTAMVLADFDGDGHLDVVISLGSLFRGNGDGTFRPPLSYPVEPSQSITTADFDGNGRPDIATATFVDVANFNVLLNRRCSP